MRGLGLPESWAPMTHGILRITTGLIFMQHAIQRLGFPESLPKLPVGSFFWLAAIPNLIGGTLILLGLFTRPVAFLLCGEMAVVYWVFHAPQSFFPLVNKGDAMILYCFVFLFLSAAGPGAWSFDAARGRVPRA